MAGVETVGVPARDVETFAGMEDAARFDATGARHGLIARLRRVIQFSLMDQLPAMAWYEAALVSAGGHFINRFGRVDTEEFARWRGPEPSVPSLMKH